MEDDNLNIILVGMPGAGKSYMGEKLAKLLVHFNYIDVDNLIEEKTGNTISEIFEKHGEEYFRNLETETIKTISKEKNQIISIGGGAFQNDENIKVLKENGLIFYLRATLDELFNRIKEETHRPLLQNDYPKKVLADLLKQREQNYLKANFVIDTDKKQAYTILNDILREYENYVKKTTVS